MTLKQAIELLRCGREHYTKYSESTSGWFDAATKKDFVNKATALDRAVKALAERDGLAVQVVQMREALEEAKCYIGMWRHEYENAGGSLTESDALEVCNDIKKAEIALLLTPTAAEAQAKANAEKAALLEWATTRMETHNEYVFPFFGPTSHDPECRFAWFRYDRKGPAYETAYDALRAAREASDGN